MLFYGSTSMPSAVTHTQKINKDAALSRDQVNSSGRPLGSRWLMTQEARVEAPLLPSPSTPNLKPPQPPWTPIFYLHAIAEDLTASRSNSCQKHFKLARLHLISRRQVEINLISDFCKLSAREETGWRSFLEMLISYIVKYNGEIF